MVRIAVVGCGKVAEKHLEAYKGIEGVEITVTDIVPKGKQVAHKHGFGWNAKPFDLVRNNGIDAVDVCTPTPSHFPFVFSALDCGKHVFCEKPLTPTKEEDDKLKAKAEESGRILMVGFLYRFHPAYQFAKHIIDDGIIGKPYYAIFRLGGRGSHRAWKHMQKTGGGAYNEIMVHMVDMVGCLFGEIMGIECLYADTLLKDREIEGVTFTPDTEDVMLIRLDTKVGAKVVCEADLLTPSYMNYAEVHGTNGSLWISILNCFPTILYCKEAIGEYWQGYNFFRFPEVDLFREELTEFVKQVKERLEGTKGS